MQDSSRSDARFAIFRGRDAPDLDEAGVIRAAMPTGVALEGGLRLAEAGYDAGHRLKLLFVAPGMSLTHV